MLISIIIKEELATTSICKPILAASHFRKYLAFGGWNASSPLKVCTSAITSVLKGVHISNYFSD